MAELYIRPENESGRTWKVWPRQDPVPPGSVCEAASYIFELRGAEDPLAADLFIDEQPVDALRPGRDGSAVWRWKPGFYAGTAEAELRLRGTSPRRFEIVTDPDVRKLTRDDFNTMVGEILEDTFSLFALSGFRKGIAKKQGAKSPPIARLEYIRSRIGLIEQCVLRISRNPRRALHAREKVIPYYHARRATGPEIMKSFRTGRVLRELNRPSRLPAILKGNLPEKIIQRVRKDSFDIPEHRQIKACLSSWAEWLLTISEILMHRSKKDQDQEISSVKAVWSGRTRTLANKITALCGLPFFSEIASVPARVEISSLFRNDPAYRAFYRVAQEMNYGLASVFGDFLDMPVARTFELFELWCFLRLVRAATAEFGAENIETRQLFRYGKQGEVTIASDSAAVRISQDLVLCFQREFKEFWLESSGKGSFSRPMKPDLVIETGREAADAPARIIVLDAKYRIGSALGDALSSIHTYRDALVREARGGAIEGVVTAAYLLTPHIPELGDRYRETALPGRLFHPEYRESFRFGAVTLRPGMTSDELRAALREILDDAVRRSPDG